MRRALVTIIWLISGWLAAKAGVATEAFWAAQLGLSSAVDTLLVEVLGSDLLLGCWALLTPAVTWLADKRSAWGIPVLLAMLVLGESALALSCGAALMGIALSLDLPDERWQSRSVFSAGWLLTFALISPWVALLAGGAILLAGLAGRRAALLGMIVWLPPVVASALLLIFFVAVPPSAAEGVAAAALVCVIGFSELSPAVAFAGAIVVLLSPTNSAVEMLDSVDVVSVEAPAELAAVLMAEGVSVERGGRFVIVPAGDGELGGVMVAESSEWVLVDRSE